MYVVNDDVIYRKVRVDNMKFGTSNDEDVKITSLQQAPKDINEEQIFDTDKWKKEKSKGITWDK